MVCRLGKIVHYEYGTLIECIAVSAKMRVELSLFNVEW